MRWTRDQWIPSVEVVITMSLTAQFGASNRQPCHTTYTLPVLSISADGSGEVRRCPATREDRVCAAKIGRLQVFPPSVHRMESDDPSSRK